MANSIEEERARLAFKQNIIRQFGDKLFHIHDLRSNGKIVPYYPDELLGEVPGSEVPGQIVLDKKEIDPPSRRLEDLKAQARAKKMRIVIAAVATGTGVGVSALIGAYFVLKHHIDKDPKSDITDK